MMDPVSTVDAFKKLAMILGAITILKRIIQFLKFVYRNTLRRSMNLSRRYGPNTWAFITGSSEGIGFSIAEQLVLKGFHVIISGRKEEKLILAAQRLRALAPKLNVEYLVVDFSKTFSHHQLLPVLENLTKDKQISVIVNNVGVDVLERFDSLDYQSIENLININCVLMSVMNRYFIQHFKARQQANSQVRSAIVNVASVAGEIPIPLHNVYSASKAFVDFLTKTVAYENQSIDFVSLRPAQVSTSMTANPQADTLFTITPTQCARGLIADLGHQTESNGFISHKIQSWIFSEVPQQLINFVWVKFLAPGLIAGRKRASG